MKKLMNTTQGSAITGRTTVANRVRNLALATILAAGIVGAPYVTANVAGAADQDDKAKDDTTNEVKTKSSTESMFKDETVYVFKNSDGSDKNITVSDWLKNGDGDKTLADKSDLKDIVNTEGNQAFTSGNNNRLTWDADGDDIYYQGSSDAKPPVDVKVTYWLNGKKVSPDGISGKSGKVKIRYDYTNTSKVKENGYTVYTPFVAMTALILDNDNFKNVKVTNAKMINDGDRTTVVGYALPGLAKSLDVDSDTVDIPEYVEITGEATGFTLSSSATYVSANLFDDVDTSDIDTSEIGDKLNEMQDAMEQLMDGSDELTDGLSQLADGSDELADGLKSAQSGTKQLSDGNSQVLAGLQQLRNGTKTSTGLVDAVNSIGTTKDSAKNGTLLGGTNAIGSGLNTLGSGLNSSLKQAQSGANQIATGAGTAKNGAKSLKNGGVQLEDGLSQLKAQFDQGVGAPNDPNTLLGGSTALGAGIGTLGTKLSSSLTQAQNGAEQLAQGAATAQQGAAALGKGATSAKAGATQLSNGTSGLITVLGKLKTSVGTDGDTADSGTLIGGVNGISDGLDTLKKQADSGLGSLESTLTGASTKLSSISSGINTNASTAKTKLDDAKEQAKKLSDGATSTTSTTTKSTGTDNSAQMATDAQALTESIDGNENLTKDEKTELKSQVQTMQKDGTQTTEASSATTTATTTTAVDSDAATALANDIDAAETALNAITGSNGTAAIDAVASGLSTAATQVSEQKAALDKGIDGLQEGTTKLKEGLQTLSAGIGTSSDSYASQTAAGGTHTLYGIANDMATGLSGSNGLIAGLAAIESGLNGDGTAENAGLAAGLGTLSAGATQLSTSIGSSLESDSELNQGLNQLGTGSNSLTSGLTTLKNSVDAGLGDESTSGTLINGAAQITTGAAALQTGLGTLQQGAKTLGSKLGASLKKNSTLNQGLKALKSGIKQVSDGLYVLKYGGKAPDGRTSAGITGAVAALGNAKTDNTLIYGSTAVSNGLFTLLKASGTAADGAQTIATNLHKAHDGSEELSDGLKQFDEQAVQKLLDYYNDDLAGLTDRVDAVVQAGKDYQTFSGKSAQMDGQVKFIYEIDGINDDDDDSATNDSSDSSDSDQSDSGSTEATNDSENND